VNDLASLDLDARVLACEVHPGGATLHPPGSGDVEALAQPEKLIGAVTARQIQGLFAVLELGILPTPRQGSPSLGSGTARFQQRGDPGLRQTALDRLLLRERGGLGGTGYQKRQQGHDMAHVNQ
jgi:hypothetical protein